MLANTFGNELRHIASSYRPITLNFVKDSLFHYVDCSSDFAKILNKRSKEKLIGETDFDLPWRDNCASVCRAEDELVVNDKKIITDRVEFVVSQVDAHDDYRYAHLVLGTRKPIFDKNGDVGLIFGSYESVPNMASSEVENFWRLNERNKFHIFDNHHHIYLTKSQAKFLFYLINKPSGMLLKDFGKLLHITPATVYSYIKSIKEIFHDLGYLRNGETLLEALSCTSFYDYFKS